MRIAYRLLLVAIVVLGAAYLYNERVCACSVKWKALMFEARGVLLRLSSAEDARFARDSAYTTRLDSLDDVSDTTYRRGPFRGRRTYGSFTSYLAVSPHVHVRITWAGKTGWRAEARHDLLDGECVIFVGTVPEPPRIGGQVPNEGEPRCDMHAK